MSTSSYLVFQEFVTYTDAEVTGRLLEAHNIPVIIEKAPELLDNNLLGRQYNNYIQLRIPADDFQRAQRLLIETTEIDMRTVDRTYMLFELNNDELADIMAKPDQWGAYNYNLAKLILHERNSQPAEQKIEALRKEYLDTMNVPRELNGNWYFWGYAFSLLTILATAMRSTTGLWLIYRFYFLPGVLGIVLGLIIITTKRTLPDGTQIMSYSTAARKHGCAMFLLAITALGLIVVKYYVV